MIILPSGKTRAVEILNFAKKDLVEDDVMILDTGKEIIVWIGKDATEEEQEAGSKIAEMYILSDPTYRTTDNTVTMVCKQEHEPEFFNFFFKKN